MRDPDGHFEHGLELIFLVAVIALSVGLYGINRCAMSPACSLLLFGE